MYIKSIQINKYKILQNINLKFNIPKENSVVNLLVGINGSGKTSFLELIYSIFNGNLGVDAKNSDFELTYFDSLDNNEYIVKPDDKTPSPRILENDKLIARTLSLSTKFQNENNGERIIYLPSLINFSYRADIHDLSLTYRFINKVDANSILRNAELYIRNYIIDKERTLEIADPNKRREEAVNSFNNIFKDTDFVTKLYDLDKNLRPIFKTITGENITIEKLSSGEKQLYARVISLLILEPKNSIILMDEPELSLHPSWQQIILNVYKNIGSNNQFFIATHSPHILASAKYNEIFIFTKKDNKILAKHQEEKLVQVDINNILEEVMQTNYIPKYIKELQEKYFKLVEENKKASKKAEEIRKKLLEYESEYSEFFQRVDFLDEFKGL